MFSTFPGDTRRNAERPAVEFGVEIGEYRGVVRIPRHVYRRLSPERPTPERCVGAYYLRRTWFESIAERERRDRQLTENSNVEISRRDLRDGSGSARSLRNRSMKKFGLTAICLVVLLGGCGGPLRGDASAGPNPGGGFYGAPNINVGRVNP